MATWKPLGTNLIWIVQRVYVHAHLCSISDTLSLKEMLESHFADFSY